MKRIATIALSLVLSFSLVACGSNNDSDNDNSNGGDVSNSDTNDDTNTDDNSNDNQDDDSNDDNSDTGGNWETDDSGRIILPDFESVDESTAEVIDHDEAESEEVALARLDDFELDFTNGGQVINNSDYIISEVNFDISLNGGERDTSIFFYGSVAPGEAVPHILNEERLAGNLESGVIDPETTEITGMWIRVHHDDGFQEIYDMYDGDDWFEVNSYEKIGVLDTEQVYVAADELDINLEVEGNTVSATVTNNSEFPLTEILVSFNASNVASPGRDEYPIISINYINDTDLDLPLLPGQTVTKSYEFDTTYEDVALAQYSVAIGTEEESLVGTTIYDYILDFYRQSKH